MINLIVIIYLLINKIHHVIIKARKGNDTMSAKSKIKAILSMNNETFLSYSKFIGTSNANISAKAKRNSWTLNDLINIGEFIGCKLMFVDEKNNITITFDKDDLKKD